MREPVINFPCKWRGRIRIPIQYIPIKIHSEFVRIKPCIAAQPSLHYYQTTVSPHVSACLCVCPQPATRRSFFLYMLVVDVFGIRNSSMKEGRMCWFLEASTQDGPVAAKAHAHTPGSWWWCSWEEHDACCQLQKLQETSCPSPSTTQRTGTTTNINTHPPIRRTLYSEESATAASGLVGPKSRERRERERERENGSSKNNDSHSG
jgi:hypothetical protein